MHCRKKESHPAYPLWFCSAVLHSQEVGAVETVTGKRHRRKGYQPDMKMSTIMLCSVPMARFKLLVDALPGLYAISRRNVSWHMKRCDQYESINVKDEDNMRV